MRRDTGQLTGHTFDVLVVGGGICGLTIACDAAQRGLSVALIERDDFGSGASFNHLRTIHGGLRYLQSFDFARSRESIKERRTLARIAPHTIQPLLFALPLYRSLTRGKLALRGGMLLDRLLSSDRNRGVPPSHWLPGGRVVSKADAIERFPGLRRRGLTGAATWSDYTTIEADRLTFSWALAAHQHGAVLANHVEAIAPLVEGRTVTGVRAMDRQDHRPLEIIARLVVNATGAAVDRLLEPLGVSVRFPFLRAMNLVTSREAADEALGGSAASGRNYFLVPWRRRALFGTWESSERVTATDTRPTERDLAGFLADLNSAFPSLELTRADVSLVHQGIVPGRPDGQGVRLEGHEQVEDHSSQGIKGLLTIAATKYTTARAVAERVVEKAIATLGTPPVACRTAVTPLPGGDLGDITRAITEARRDFDAQLPSDTIPHLIAAYGSRFTSITDLVQQRPDLGQRLAPTSPVIGAQLVWAVREEMAGTLRDAVLRRTPLGAIGHPGDAAAHRAAAIMASELGWTERRTDEELHSLREFYALI